ncbi:MAG: helix-turn-helix domain-containing protein [Lachnospiraceae bacterium]|nr:helix-turn-helix domain-containing protein [Lachnospiraceae bacterium]
MNEKLELFTIDQICEILHLSRSTVYKMFRKGDLPGRKIGGKWQINISKLKEYISEVQD